MRKRLWALACCVASTSLAQIGGGYLGPAILSSGANGVGNRSGQQVDLRFYAGVTGIYDSSIQPLAIDSKGNLVTISGLYGVEASIGAYGTHSWRTAQLGLDYHGAFRAYNAGSAYDGIDQSLSLGYTLQESRRLGFSGRVMGGIVSNSLGGLGNVPALATQTEVVPATLLFDSRSYYLQGGLDMIFRQTARTSFTVSGEGFDVWRQSAALVGVEGYTVRGTVEHKLNKNSSVGFTYSREHFNFPRAFGAADIDLGEGFVGTNFSRFWAFTLRGGVFHAQVKGLQSVALDPVIAALLGQPTVIQAFYRENIYPSGAVSLARRFKNANLNFSYGRSVGPGNGVYLTSRTEVGSATYSYTGIRKANLAISGGYNSLDSLGQGIQPYRSGYAGAGFTYTLPRSLHVTGRYDYRYQAIEELVYKHFGYRASLGLVYSPGKVPLSLW